MKIDKEMDHGPILIQKIFSIQEMETNLDLESLAGERGAKLIIDNINNYLNHKLIPIEQDHSKATFTYKFQKDDGEISLNDPSQEIQNKFKALPPHIPIFFFIHNKNNQKLIRVKVSQVNLNKDWAKNKLADEIILKVIPEGKKEMSFTDFKKGYLK